MGGPRLNNIFCACCGIEVKPKTSRTKYCSKDCQYKAKSKEIGSTKYCPHCNINKPVSEFFKCRNKLQAWCKACQRSRPRSYRIDVTCSRCGLETTIKRSTSKLTSWTCLPCSREIVRENNGGHPPNYKGSKFISGRTLYGWKYSAAKRGHSWNITKEDIDTQYLKQQGICALSGLEMELSKRSIYRPSLDRIDSTKGYTPDNIQFVCSAINMMKNKLDEAVFVALCKSIALHSCRCIPEGINPNTG